MRREREPGASPGLSRSGMQERQLPVALAPMGWEAAAIRYTRQRVWACESEYLPTVPGAPHPAVHRLAEWAQPAGCEPSGDGHRFRPKGTTVHIEPGIVEGSKIALSYATAGGVGLYGLRATWRALQDRGASSLLLRRWPQLPWPDVLPGLPSCPGRGFGGPPDSGLDVVPGGARSGRRGGAISGLLLQGMFFAPFDLPQYVG